MRFDLRLLGHTASGQACQALLSVYADSQRDLQARAQEAAETAVWLAADPPHEPIEPGSAITVEHVERV